MKLTEEQKEVIDTSGNLCINAFAGTGKTSTMIEYAKARPNESFLYLCFNRSVRDFAENKFPENVYVKNSHSLAYGEIGAKKWSLCPSFDVFHVIDSLNIKKRVSDTSHHIKLASHILRAFEIYCGEGVSSFKNFCYSSYTESSFGFDNLEEINSGAKKLFKEMEDGNCDISHSFYLKKYQLSNPQLDFDYIIADEAQDTSGCVIDILLKQAANKVIVGDQNQSIYSFIRAIDALGHFSEFNQLKLTHSFRFRQDVANLAMQILKMKEHLGVDCSSLNIKGLGPTVDSNNKAFLARSNIKLIEEAADIVSFTNKSIHFEGNINNYLFSNGVGVYDIFYLWQGNKSKVKNKILSHFEDFYEYKDFVKDSGNTDQQVLCSMVEKYRSEIFPVIKEIKRRCVDKNSADVILSTLHKAKGLGFGEVEIASDFVKEDDVIKNEDDKLRMIEEINILYTAVTRTESKIKFPYFYLNEYPELRESKL